MSTTLLLSHWLLFVVAPPLSVDSVMVAMKSEGHKWKSVGYDHELNIPDGTLSHIAIDCMWF